MTTLWNGLKYTGIIMTIRKKDVCPKCGYKEAIKWNPYNRVTQCHNCGQVVDDGVFILS